MNTPAALPASAAVPAARAPLPRPALPPVCGPASPTPPPAGPTPARRVRWLGALACGSLPLIAAAQTAPATGADQNADALPTVTVTAEKRETDQQKTPVAVGTVGASAIEQSAHRGLVGLVTSVAGVTVPSSYPPGYGSQSLFIRGIGISRLIGNPSVGVYLDDVYLPKAFGIGSYGSLPDVERIEILRGPQGTLYGQNTSAGSVKLLSIDPDGERRAWLEARAGNYGAFETRGYLTGSVQPGVLNASLAVSHRQNDGYIHNPVLDQDQGRLRVSQARLKFKLTPSPTFDAVLSIDGTRDRSGYWASTPDDYPGTGPRRTFTDTNTNQRHDNGGASLKLTKRLTDALTLRSITAARGFDARMPSPSFGVPGYQSGFTQDLEQRQLSQEFQLLGGFGAWDFISGLSVFRERFEMDRLSWNNGAFSILRSDSTSTSAGLYAQVGYRPTEALRIAAGLRVNRDRREMDIAGFSSNADGAVLANTFTVDGQSKRFSGVTPKVSVDYQWTPQLFTYASWAKGETAGGFNPIAPSAAIARVPVEPEKVTTYELGLKANGWSNRLRSAFTVFYSDYRDYQSTIANPIVDGVPITGGVILNAGRAHLYGAELETTVKPTRNLEGSIALSYLRSQFDDFLNPTGASSTDFTGQELPNAPRWTLGARVDYRIPLADGAVVRLNGSIRRQTQSYSGLSSVREQTKNPAQTIVDAGASYTLPRGDWIVTLAISNLFDRDYVTPTYTPAYNYRGVTYNAPRQVLLGIRHDFY